MLKLFDGRLGRRSFLTIGSAALGGWSLPGMLRAKESPVGRAVKGRSVVVLNLQGGPTQFETFDPNMQAPEEIRSITGETKTSLPGVTFGGTLPLLAARAHQMSIVRSYRHGISSHGPAAMHVMAGGNPTGAQMGALYSRVAGLTDAESGMPQNVLLTARAMGDAYREFYYNADRVSQTGTLPQAYRPFDPSAGSTLIENMKLRVDGSRLDDRSQLLAQLDQLRRRAEHERLATADRIREQAFEILVRGVADAFDWRHEDPRLIERYETREFEPSDAVKKRNAYAQQFSPVALGKQMLLARRLCESGCGFVTVTCAGWDMHGGGKEFTMADGLASLLPAVDKAVSAFLDDVESRGLSDKILLVITGEFGRTPRINKNGGRDHWGNLCTLAFAGGGLRMGRVVGRSDRNGAEPASDPISSRDVLSTVMHSLFDTSQVRLLTEVPREVERVITGGKPILDLM